MKIILFFLLIGYCANVKEETIPTNPKSEIADDETMSSSVNYAEQISCSEKECARISFESFSDLDDKISNQMTKNVGKFLIHLGSRTTKLNDEKLEDVVSYLREIQKREGRVSIEPYYIGQREASSPPGISAFTDSAMIGFTLYKRIKNLIKYSETKNYHAKVLYHPKTEKIMMIFFVHKNFGDVCSTIYSNCKQIEYLDDESFDLSLSNALKDSNNNKEQIQVFFRQSKAILPEATIDFETLKQINSSTRIYKWLVASKKTEKKTTKKDRFLGIQAVITILDYSIKAYDYVKAYQLYEPAFKRKVELVYSGKENGGKIESIVFFPPEIEKE